VTVRQLIASSLRLLGVLARGESLSANDGADALSVLNDLLDAWGADRLTLYSQFRSTFAMSAGDGEYTIGSGGNFNQARPLWIDKAAVLRDGRETEIRLYTRDEYNAISDKTTQGTSLEGVLYNAENPLGKLQVYPVPSDGNSTLVLYGPADALASVASLDTAISQPKGWNRALRYNLAVELAPEYGVEPSGLVLETARESLAAIKRPNILLESVEFDPALVDTGAMNFNMQTGE
jgi:hypothetical protein